MHSSTSKLDVHTLQPVRLEENNRTRAARLMCNMCTDGKAELPPPYIDTRSSRSFPRGRTRRLVEVVGATMHR